MSIPPPGFSEITIEVPNRPLPVRMRLGSFSARRGRPVPRRRALQGLAPLLPVIGVAGLATSMRRGRRIA
jgi:hypothetical protein